MLRGRAFIAASVVITVSVASAQTTQAVISGRVYDGYTGTPIGRATVTYTNAATLAKGEATTNPDGYYALSLLSPGTYMLRAESLPAFQSGEIHELRVEVASRIRTDFQLRRLNQLWESVQRNVFVPPGGRAVLPYYGPDVETGRTATMVTDPPDISSMQSSLSYVIDPQLLGRLPLPSRDVYTLIITLPGVTVESATGRGLGLSVNGQRPSSSNFLLDGVENNDYLLTGPFTTVAPEATQEYRISTNNFSAEFGGTAGVLANAVTRSGTTSLHGLAYGYDDVVRANSFQSRALGHDTPPRRETYAGFAVGGPLAHDSLLFSSAFERLRGRGRRDSKVEFFPSLESFRLLHGGTAALQLLERYPPPSVRPPAINGTLATSANIAEPLSLDRYVALERIDFVPQDNRRSTHRLFGRLILARTHQPDFIYSPYAGFHSELRNASTGLSVNYTRHVSVLTTEFRAGVRRGDLGFNRPAPEIPQLLVFAGDRLPGSEQPSEFRNRDTVAEFGNTTVMSWSSHVISVGGGFLMRNSRPLLAFQSAGQYTFATLSNFAFGTPGLFQVTASAPEVRAVYPDPVYDREWANRSFYGFLQDAWQISRRLTVSPGLRYESFGALKNTRVQDAYLEPGPGPSLQTQVEGARLLFDPGHQRSLYQPDRNNWAPRIGIAYRLDNRFVKDIVFRGAFGIFYDRLYDNLFLSSILNNLNIASFNAPRIREFEQPLSLRLAQLGSPSVTSRTSVLWVAPNLRTPAVRSWFAGLQKQVGESNNVELSYRGAVSGNLVASDSVNRLEMSTNKVLNEGFKDIRYRSNAGASDYHALSLAWRYRSTRGQFHAAYTLGHATDNQSEPLRGEFSDIGYARGQQQTAGFAAFTRLGESGLDWGNSDYDQRHNLTFFSVWEMPGVNRGRWLRRFTEGWRLAQLAGIRSGFPFSVTSNDNCSPCQPGLELLNNRANLLPGANPRSREREAVQGGVQFLDRQAFQNPPAGQIGNLRRNSLKGPGLWNLDASVARVFRATESVSVELRADVFNVFNHANLGNPIASLSDQDFGRAFFGRVGIEPPLRIVPPLAESPRRLQLQLKLVF